MTGERDTRTMLAGKTILLLSNGEDSTSELGLKLTLYGGKVLAVGENEAMLSQLQHEVQDIGGTLTYCILDYDDPAAVSGMSAFLRSTVGTLHALVDNTGQDEHVFTRALLDALENVPDHIVLVNHTNGASNHTFDPPAATRTSVIATDVGEASLPCAAEGIPAATDLYAAILARETAYLISDAAYHAVNQVVLADDGDDLVARLYSGTRRPRLLDTIRRGRIHKVYIACTEMGRAVFAGGDFKRGDLIFEFNGVPVGHQTEHSLQVGWDCHLEPDSPIRLLNHSCDPNVGVKTNTNGWPDFYAFSDIRQGEELNFDYAMTEYAHYPRDNEALEFGLECQCGAPDCRGRLGYFSELPEAIKQKYDGFVSAYFSTQPPD